MNLKIIETFGEKELNSALDLADLIYRRTDKKSKFNWPTEKLREEFKQARVWLGSSEEGAILGFVAFRDLGEAFEVTVLATHPGEQKRGVQTQILKCLQDFAATQNKRIWLEVHVENEVALSLYLRCGFKVQRRRKAYYSDGDDACEMTWSGADEPAL